MAMPNWFRRLIGPSINTRLFLLITLLETAIDITIEGLILRKFRLDNLLQGGFGVGHNRIDNDDTDISSESDDDATRLMNRGWGDGDERWRRPHRRVLAALGGALLSSGGGGSGGELPRDRLISIPRSLANNVSSTASSLLSKATSIPSSSSSLSSSDPLLIDAAARHGHEDSHHRGGPTKSKILPVYLSIFVIAHLFQFALACEGIWNRNTIQIIGLGCFNLAFLVYAVIQIGEIQSIFSDSDHIDVLVDVIPIVISLCELAYVGLAWFIYRDFGWEVYKKIGADRMIKKMYMFYQVYICVLKFGYFFFISFSLQFLALVLSKHDIERTLTIIALPVTLICLVLGYVAVRYEKRVLMAAFMFGCIAAAGYFAFKLYRIFQNTDGDYDQVQKSLGVFSAISFLVLIATFGLGWKCWKNFGRGLRLHMDSPMHGSHRVPHTRKNPIAATLRRFPSGGKKNSPDTRRSEILDAPTSAELDKAGKGFRLADDGGESIMEESKLEHSNSGKRKKDGSYPPRPELDPQGAWVGGRMNRMSID